MSTTQNLDRIVEIGKRRGSLTIDDLSEYLPIETLAPAELTEIITAIENAGVTIEIDPSLLKGRPRLVEPTDTIPTSRGDDPVETGQKRLTALDSSIRQSKSQIDPPRDPGNYKGGTVFVAVAAVVCALVLIGVWLIARGV